MSSQQRPRSDTETSVTSQLDSIKRLLILVLVRLGSSQQDIARALNVNQSSISRMFPKGLPADQRTRARRR